MLDLRVQKCLHDWVSDLQDGDVIRVVNGNVYLYNELGYKINSSYECLLAEKVVSDVKYSVNNVSKSYAEHEYSVIRDVENEYWYYGSYNSIERAQEVSKTLGNGLVVKSRNIDVLYFN